MKNTAEIQTAEISKLIGNCMGTTDIYMKLKGMRQPEAFIVYPIHRGDDAQIITIQSGKRLGYLNLTTGEGTTTPSHQNGAYNHHYTMAQFNGTLQYFKVSREDVNRIKMQIFGTTNQNAGNNGAVFCDNSGAVNVL